jgi:Amt family ammonium transporter
MSLSSSGDISWVATATALVMLMTPALGFFYAGLVRKKNLVSTLIQCLIIFAVKYGLGFMGLQSSFRTIHGGVIGNLDLLDSTI